MRIRQDIPCIKLWVGRVDPYLVRHRIGHAKQDEPNSRHLQGVKDASHSKEQEYH